MSLVAYESSDSEENGEDSETPTSSFVALPKKHRETVKITIPSLEEFKDEDADAQPLKKPKMKSGCGLFSILPPPKYSAQTTSQNFTPYVLTKKKESKVKPSEVKHLQKLAADPKKVSPEQSVDSDPEIYSNEKDEGSVPGIDYFSLDVSSSKFDDEVPQTQSKSVLFSSLPKPAQNTEFCEASSSSQEQSALPPSEILQIENNFSHQSWDENYPTAVDAAEPQTSFLNDERFKKIKGKRDKGDIDIIDINADDQLTGKDQWLMQNLTEEAAQRPSKRRYDMPTQQQKRKHQITYLAFQAKERELDLKNQWSLNSRTRRETQAKYGF